MGQEKVAAKKSGLDIATDTTIKIVNHLNPNFPKDLVRTLTYDIFDDQLKAHTKMNREQRHKAKKLFKVRLEERESE